MTKKAKKQSLKIALFYTFVNKLPILALLNIQVIMKKFLVIAASVLIFSSCTKDYSCDCASETTGVTDQLTFKTNRKSHAERLCNDYANNIRNSVTDQEDYTCDLN